MDLAQMDAEEEAEFREAVGAGESGMNRIIRLSYDVVGLITFLTIGDDEVRAWELPKGTTASRAAGRIHTDFEQGFIRAEVVEFDDLVTCGGFAEARKRGVLRQEGKDYVVQDGDVMHVLVQSMKDDWDKSVSPPTFVAFIGDPIMSCTRYVDVQYTSILASHGFRADRKFLDSGLRRNFILCV